MPKICQLSPGDTILEALNKMAEAGKQGSLVPGLAYVADSDVVVGSLSDGDIRKLIGGMEFDNPLNQLVKDVMNNDPVIVQVDAVAGTRDAEFSAKRNVAGIFVVDTRGRLVDVIAPNAMIDRAQEVQLSPKSQSVFVYGLGFVGLTLSLHIARHGITAYGLDVDETYVRQIQAKKVPFFEVGLNELLDSQLNQNFIPHGVADVAIPNKRENTQAIFILAVGTPIVGESPDESQLISAASNVAENLAPGDLVLLRSTVKAFSSEKVVIPLIEELSEMRCGHDFFYAVAPERTAEGVALQELEVLPQLVGADDKESLEVAVSFLEKIFPQVVGVGSTVQAEYAKLLCNSYRDVSFAFANEFSVSVEEIGINASALIEKINLGYPRGGIPMPSPGVGGYCLTKDPCLYAQSLDQRAASHGAALSVIGRRVNQHAALSPIRALEKFVKARNLHLNNTKVLVVGVAFKGRPTTDDTRYSCAVSVAKLLESMVQEVFWVDFAVRVSPSNLQGVHEFASDQQVPQDVDAIIVMNNHPDNTRLKIRDWISDDSPKLFFDGWLQFKFLSEKKYSQRITYATMGSLGPSFQN